MPDSPFMRNCELCNSQFEYGAHRYAGTYIPKYQLLVCTGCYQGNWDGWGPIAEERFVAHLKSKGIPLPQRNEKGWYPRD
jgi:hypothetical protein